VTITDAENCEMTASITLNEPPALTAQVAGEGGGCTDENSGSATAIAGGGVAPYTYLWSNSGTTPTITNLAEGSYFVTIYDSNGCTMTSSGTVPPSQSLAIVPIGIPDSGGPNGQAIVQVVSGTAPFTFTWQDFPDEQDSIVTELLPGDYLVVVKDANGCQAATIVDVPDETLCGEVLTVITPEGDGKNEEFIISCLGRYSDNTLEIYNRWGQLVYMVDNYNDSDLWRGTTERGEDVPDGVYYYVFHYLDPVSNAYVTKKGSVTVIRK
jgi:gliding motility-associated-like protein